MVWPACSSFWLEETNWQEDGNSICFLSWTLPNTIKANDDLRIPLSLGPFNNYDECHVKMKVADLSKLTIDYQVDKLIFDDGTSISL